jgi:isopenicillin-N epimerase
MCCPKGSGFLYVRPDAQQLIEPLVVSWDWVDENGFAAQNRWQGTRDPSAYLSVPAAIDFQAEHDWPAVRTRCHALLERARVRLPLEPLTDEFVQMLGFRLRSPGPASLGGLLYTKYGVEVPVFETASGWVLRVSIQAYNDEEDVEALGRALDSVGAR